MAFLQSLGNGSETKAYAADEGTSEQSQVPISGSHYSSALDDYKVRPACRQGQAQLIDNDGVQYVRCPRVEEEQ